MLLTRSSTLLPRCVVYTATTASSPSHHLVAVSTRRFTQSTFLRSATPSSSSSSSATPPSSTTSTDNADSIPEPLLHIPRRMNTYKPSAAANAKNASSIPPFATPSATTPLASPATRQPTIEELTTGSNAHPGEIPRDGPYPKHPYLDLDEEYPPDATSPNWAWENIDDPARRPSDAGKPCPRPLPFIYVRSSYRTTPELSDRKRRMLHVFTCLLTGALGFYMVFEHDHTHAYNKEGHVLTPLQNWWKGMKVKLFVDPAEEYQREKLAALATQLTSTTAK